MGALPDTVKDWAGAQATATWGLENGRSRPLELEDRPFERAPPPIQKTQAEAAQQGGMPPLDFDNGYFDALAASVDASPTKPARKSKRTAEAHNLDDDRPLISIKAGFLDKLATEAEDVLLASGLPVFQRGSALVRPVAFEVPASRGRTTVSAGLSEMTPAGMIDTYSQIARWERYDKRAEEWLPADPPPLVAAVHLSRIGFWKLPPVAGIITTPTLRPDGTVLLEPGYDRATRLYYVPDPTLKMPTLIAKPSRTDAEAALELLLSLLTGFPFVTDVSKAVALSMLITPVVRGALSVAPLHAAKAITAGTGKSYLVDLASAIATGRACPVAAAATNPEETEKRLVGLLLSAFPIVSLDNVNGELGGDVLCQAVERPLIRVRPLGASKIIEIESRCCIFATGNGLRISGDMVRRSLLAVLDAEMERPELRTFSFDPVSTVLADRGTYVAACMTIVRAYTAAGSPRRQAALASFEDWSDLVRSTLIWLGQADPCRSMEEAREDDPELTDIREMIAGWRRAFGTLSVPVKKAVEAASATIGQADENGDVPAYGATYILQHPELRDVLMRLSGARPVIDSARIGRWLLSHEGRIVGGYRFKRDGTTDGAARWKLDPVGRQGDQGG